MPPKRSSRSSHSFLDEQTSLLEMGGLLVMTLAVGFLFHRFNVASLEPTISSAIGLGTVFIVGITAAFSTCLAVVGGLLLSVSATWNDTKRSLSHAERFEPLFLFNVGRLTGYFFLGGVVGIIGKTLALSTKASGVLTILIALVMILLGLRILRLIPKEYCSLPFPRSWNTSMKKLARSRNPLAPLLLGILTFFIPCGFTQSMQLLALGSGSFLAGASIMFIFALGTLPALLGISMLSAFTEGKKARLFTRFSAVLVLLLGILNVQSGFALMGIDVTESLRAALAPRTPEISHNVSINQNGQQIISLNVSDAGFSPAMMTIAPGKETWIYANAPHGISGCAASIVAPAYGISTVVKQGENWLGPIKNPESDFLITCSTGVLRANVHVEKSS